jgi:hypothetical protein
VGHVFGTLDLESVGRDGIGGGGRTLEIRAVSGQV